MHCQSVWHLVGQTLPTFSNDAGQCVCQELGSRTSLDRSVMLVSVLPGVGLNMFKLLSTEMLVSVSAKGLLRACLIPFHEKVTSDQP